MMKKALFISIGIFFVALGVIGIFLPIMPTTIFLILASYFFMKSSPELNAKLLNNKYLGPYLKNYLEKRGMPLKSKISSICLLWTSILISSYFLTENLTVRIILLFVAVGVTIHLATIKNLKPQSIRNQ
jgi:uncharacterized membrane protein YbaN (DUF454 family)